MIRINFWPYDHEFLLAVAGTGEESYLEEVDKLVSTSCSNDDSMLECYRCARLMARCVIQFGLEPNGNYTERWCHKQAAYLLVDPITRKHKYPYGETYPSTEYGYLGFLDAFPTQVFSPIPHVLSALEEGAPWFGNACGNEELYGKISREDISTWAKQCAHNRDEFQHSAWVLDPILELFAFTEQYMLDLWFSVG